jgi:hypothetical protein
MSSRFLTKPAPVTAICFTAADFMAAADFCRGTLVVTRAYEPDRMIGMLATTGAGIETVELGDWLVKDAGGRVFLVRGDDFWTAFERDEPSKVWP